MLGVVIHEVSLRHSWKSTLPQALSREALLQAEPQDAQSDQYSELPQFYPSACEQNRHELEGNLSFVNLQSNQQNEHLDRLTSVHQHISPQQWPTADAAYQPLLDQGSA